MRQSVRVGCVWAVLVCLASAVAGCTPVKDKAHDLSNAFSGNYDAILTTTPAEVVAATRAAVQDLHLILISEKKDAQNTTSIVIARSSDDDKVTVAILPFGSGQTRFTVSTGVFGNSSLRQQVMDGIKLHLGPAVLRPATQASQPAQ